MYHKRRKTMEMTREERLLKFIFVDGEVDFYEEHLMGLTDEEIQRFFDENPDFMSGLPVNDISLLRDEMWRGILRKIEKRIGENKTMRHT
jgi:hypothetical protein